MVWIVDSQACPSAENVNFEESPTVAKWASNLAALEIQRLEAGGIKALPLTVQRCGQMGMSFASGASADAQSQAFNVAHLNTSFDFSRTRSLSVSMERHGFEDEVKNMYFCAMCLMRVDMGVREAYLSFPFVFQDLSNALTHWAIVNKKDEVHYIVRQEVNTHEHAQNQKGVETDRIVHDSSSETTASTAASTACESVSDVVSESEESSSARAPKKKKELTIDPAAVIRALWDTLSLQERKELMSISDSDIFSELWNNLQLLFRDGGSAKHKRTLQQRMSKEFPLLSALEFQQKMGYAKAVAFADSILLDSDAFWIVLNNCCPKLFSGKTRRRREPADWCAMLSPPARNFQRLQLRVAQILEQKLWALQDGPAYQEIVHVVVSERNAADAQKHAARRKIQSKTASDCFASAQDMGALASESVLQEASQDTECCNDSDMVLSVLEDSSCSDTCGRPKEDDDDVHCSDICTAVGADDDVASLLRQCFEFAAAPLCKASSCEADTCQMDLADRNECQDAFTTQLNDGTIDRTLDITTEPCSSMFTDMHPTTENNFSSIQAGYDPRAHILLPIPGPPPGLSIDPDLVLKHSLFAADLNVDKEDTTQVHANSVDYADEILQIRLAQEKLSQRITDLCQRMGQPRIL